MLKSVIGTSFIALSVVTISACAPDLVAGTGASSSSAGGAGTGGMEASSSANSSGVGGASSSSSSGSAAGELGSPCGTSNDCLSQFVCEDGVCCDGPCDTCKSCNQAGSIGKCSGLSTGTDDCSSNGQLCDKTGMCACGISVPPAVDSGCPADPTWSNPSPGLCAYTCDQAYECKDLPTIVCPPGADCIIDCSGNHACEGTTFNCPPGHSCTLKCTNQDSCKNATLNCSDDGPCNIECTGTGTVCYTTVNCGFNSCSATCLDTSKPTMVPKAGSVCPVNNCP